MGGTEKKGRKTNRGQTKKKVGTKNNKKEKKETKEKISASESEIELIKEQQDDGEDDKATTFVRNKGGKVKNGLNKKSNPRKSKAKQDDEDEELLLASKDYEFKFVTEEPNALIAFLTSLLSLTNKGIFTPLITTKGIYHLCQDVDGYLISETTLEKTRIDSRGKYICPSLETDASYFTFSCDLKELKTLVTTKKDEKLKLCVKTSDIEKLNIVIYRTSGNISKSIPIQISNEDIPMGIVPKYPKDLQPIFKVKGALFASDVKQLKCTYVKLTIQKKALLIQGYDEQCSLVAGKIEYGKWNQKNPVKAEGFVPLKIITGISKYGAVSYHIRFFVYGNLPLKVLGDVGNMGWHAHYLTLKDKPVVAKKRDD